jgi:hypothetical protein
MPFSGMVRRLALVRTDVSEELSASIISVKKIGELGTTLAVTSTLMMEALSSSEASVLTRTTRRYVPEDGIIHLFTFTYGYSEIALCSSGQSSCLLTQRSRVRFPALQDFLSSSGSGAGSTQLL